MVHLVSAMVTLLIRNGGRPYRPSLQSRPNANKLVPHSKARKRQKALAACSFVERRRIDQLRTQTFPQGGLYVAPHSQGREAGRLAGAAATRIEHLINMKTTKAPITLGVPDLTRRMCSRPAASNVPGPSRDAKTQGYSL